MTSDSEQKTPKWLKHLQENSWEAEILISGGAIFSLFQINDFVLYLYHYLKIVNPFLGLNLGLIIATIATKGLTIGFVLHLLFRSYWIALNCIHYSSRDKIEKTDAQFQNNIIKIDHISGILFANSLLFVLFTVGFYFLFLIGTIVIEVFSDKTPLNIYLAIIALYWIDLIVKGKLRQLKFAGRIIAPLFGVLDFVSLGFLYRQPWHYIIQFIGHWKSGLIAFSFSVLTFVLSFSTLNRIVFVPSPLDKREFNESLVPVDRKYNPYNYKSESGSLLVRPRIQSPIINEDFLQLEIGYGVSVDEFIKNSKVSSFAEIIEIQINDSTIQNVSWRGKAINAESDFSGVVAFIDISHLGRGEQNLNIYFRDNQDKFLVESIPFWKQ